MNVLTGAERFQWLGACPSLRLEFLYPAGQTETMVRSPKEGIFVLPHETTEIFKEIQIKRVTSYSNLNQDCYNRVLQPTNWLSDEVVNGYMALILSSVKSSHPPVGLIISQFYKKISLDGCKPGVIKGYVSWIPSYLNKALIWYSFQGKMIWKLLKTS
jgi:hypothetical protein